MIIGFNFTKIAAEKKDIKAEKVNINNNIGLSNVVERDLVVKDANSKALAVSFVFELMYQPDLGHIRFEGEVVLLLATKQAADTIDSWKKTRSLPKELMENVMKTVFSRCQIQALIIARDLNMPNPVPLPKIKVDVAPRVESVKPVAKK